jgi:hypothetical protein
MEEDYPNLRVLGISEAHLLASSTWPYELPYVRSLKVELLSHGDEDDHINNGSIRLLRCCTSLTCLDVSLHVDMVCIQKPNFKFHVFFVFYMNLQLCGISKANWTVLKKS